MKNSASVLRAAAVALLLIAAREGVAAADQQSPAATGAGKTPDHIVLTWTDDPHTTQTISWRTDPSVTTGSVRFQKGSSVASAAAVRLASRSDFITDLGPVAQFSVTITGLEPGASYSYQVGTPGAWSKSSTFSTEKKGLGAFTFLVFGDSQSGIADDPEYGPWKTTVQNAFAAFRDARFLVNVGDLVEVGQSCAHWNAWFDAAAGVIDRIPEMAVEGNHETYGAGAVGSVKPFYLAVQFPLPRNGPDGLEGQVYSWDYGAVHFVVLDCQEDEEGPTYGDILSAQAAWLDDDLGRTKQPWKIVFFHKTPYYLKASRTNEAVKAAFCPVLDKHHVDVVFNGHDHGIARTYALKADEMVARPSQGTIYVVTGRSGNKAYPDLSRKVWNTFFYDPQDQPNYLVARVEGQTLTIRSMKQDGTLIDTFSIDKVRDTDSDMALFPVPTGSWTRYSAPTLVVYGNVVSPLVTHHAPVQKDGAWYVDLGAFAATIGATVVAREGNAVVIADGKAYPIPSDMLFSDRVTLVSVQALAALGFRAAFHAATNMLEITR